MYKKNLCQNCTTCLNKQSSEESSSIKISWREEQRLEDLRLELDTLCEELKLLRGGDPVLNHNITHELEENLLTTYKYAVKLGLSYQLDDI